MRTPLECAVVIPCHNESATLGPLVGAVRRYAARVFVVDDGSTDDTRAVAQAAGAEVLSHGQNRGKGAALETGLSHARQQGLGWAITLDGDGQHVPTDVPAFLEGAAQTGALLVVGNRMADARALPWVRRYVNRWLSRQLSRLAGRSLPDTQCGFRLIHLATWAGLPRRSRHFEVESEMLMAFLAAGHPVAFVPIQVIGRGPRSHIRPLLDAWRWWKWWRSGARPRAPVPSGQTGRPGPAGHNPPS